MNTYDECLRKARRLFTTGKHAEAMAWYSQALKIDPTRPEAYYETGQLLQFSNRPDEAHAYYLKTLELNPQSAQSYAYLGLILREKGDMDNAIKYYKNALLLNPHYADAWYWLGNAYKLIGRHEEAIAAYDQAAQYKPYHILGRWMSCMCQLPVLYPDTESILLHRERYRNRLLSLREAVSLETPEDIQSAVKAVGSQQPFYLAHQGLNDRELQKVYGDLVCRIMAARYPEFTGPPLMPVRSSGTPVRVGIVSAYFSWHSVWKIPTRGLLENLNRERFHICCYHTGKHRDQVTETARRLSDRFIENVSFFDELCRIIRDDRLDVIIYPEVGMDPVTLCLASLRLAPVQCVALGHPDTTGLPTLDYYLSSELMEPPDGADHYTERLVRLPNLSFSYMPFTLRPAEVDRDAYWLPRTSVIYLCSHQLPTHLPQYDDIYPRIAGAVKDCRFLFISHRSAAVTEQFRERIGKAFRRAHLDPDAYVVFLPILEPAEYLAVNRFSDIFLDTMGWSSNNSTFEAIACNLPVVTLPGALMRQRHCAAILTMMGATETIAGTIDEYIALAVRLGKDPDWRKDISNTISEKKHRIYRDLTAIRGLEDFLIRAVSGG